VNRRVTRGSVISWADVTLDESSSVVKLRREQDSRLA